MPPRRRSSAATISPATAAWCGTRRERRAGQGRVRGRALGQALRRSDGAAVRHGAERVSARDRKSVVEGKSVYVRVDLGGRRLLKKKNVHRANTTQTRHIHNN